MRLGVNSSVPDWLAQRKVEGSASIGTLRVGGTLLSGDYKFSVDAPHLAWEGASVHFSPLNARLLDAGAPGAATVLKADLAIDLLPAAAQYRWKGKLADVPYKGGRLDFDGIAEAVGEGPAMLASLHATGMLSGRAIAFSPGALFRAATGQFEVSWQGTSPRWKFTDVAVIKGNEVFTGQGASAADGKIVLDLKNPDKSVQYTDSLASASAKP
jgi:hypothetical protein